MKRSHRPPMRHLVPAGQLLMLVAATAACGEDFPPYNRIEGTRVLAIIADPPRPGPGETVTLSALTFRADAGASENTPGLTYAWSWCPFEAPAEAGYPCQVTQEELAMLGPAAAGLPPLDLGNAPTAMLPHTIDPALLGQLCAGVPGAPVRPDCTGGYPVQVKVRITSTAPDGTMDEVTAVLTLRLRFDPATPPNTRPRLDGLFARVADVDVPLTDAPAVAIPRAKETLLKVAMSPEVSETYLGRDFDLRPAMVRERLTLTWFVETGDTKANRTSFIDGELPFEAAIENKWTPPREKDFARTAARVVVVVRDDRGGVAWRSGVVALSPTEGMQ